MVTLREGRIPLMRVVLLVFVASLASPSLANTDPGMWIFSYRECSWEPPPIFTTFPLEFEANIPTCPEGIRSISFRVDNWPVDEIFTIPNGDDWQADLVEGDIFSGITLSWNSPKPPDVWTWHNLGSASFLLLQVDPFDDPRIVSVAISVGRRNFDHHMGTGF